MRCSRQQTAAPMRDHLKLTLALERLNEIASTIAALKALMRRKPALAAACRLAMGALLVEAKALVPKRRWMAWLEANVPYDTSSCRRLMQTVRGCPPATIEQVIGRGMAALKDELQALT